ncbi:MAG: isocitrate/isopropylmalate family dehydrogenase [Solirubrobacterales bacterium]
MPAPLRIVVLDGDETGQELLDAALRVLDSDVVGIELALEHFDLSLAARRASDNGICSDAAAAIRDAGLGLKAATITPEGADDVGSPNRLIREGIDGTVIVRTGRRIPGVTPIAGIFHPISICRMAVGDAYGAEQWREMVDGDEIAYRTERISRRVCRAVAEYSFQTAETLAAKVYGGPKWTVSPVYEGMLKEEMDAAADRHPEVPYEPVLIDATYAGLVSGAASEPLVIPTLNRDGDLLSDLVMPMFGSIAGAESTLLSLDQDLKVAAAMAEAPHGTAPALEGKDIANPMAMVLASAAVLHYAGERGTEGAERASRAIYEATLEAAAAGVRTPDLGGQAGTAEVCEEIAARVIAKREAWSSLGGPRR